MAKLRLEVQGLLEIQEQITVILLNEPGLHLQDLRAKVEQATGYTSSTIGAAITHLNEEGSFTKIRDGRKVRYYWNDQVAFGKNERVLPVRRPVIDAAAIPRCAGVRMNPIQWTVKFLEAV